MIRKLLVANRGEIACRVFRTSRRLGIATVAVYSDADAQAVHVREADEAVRLGPAEAALSYLDMAKVLDAAKQTGADAIHPGYGFLSERAEFVEACDRAGVTFVGPSAAAMHKLGAKIDAKQLAVSCGVPITPGYFEPGASVDDLARAADEIGYPVMVKASAGGGGRGMRVVRDASVIREEIELASVEALKAFGDGAMMVEKLIERPRHIEVQFVADQHGAVACLFERECSLQRRHQKVVEEAPSPYVGAELWDGLKSATERLVKAAGYHGAGTAEFMVDPVSGEFYFLEVNARLQVEHPVTEAITGLDLVELQLRVAQGLPLGLSDLWLSGSRELIRGHAIEVRVIAEDPAAGFLPSVGTLVGWAPPSGEGVRFDSGFEEGSEVTPYYDSMLAKLIVYGSSRSAALSGLVKALQDTHVLGVRTNLEYVLDVVRHPSFAAGDMDTGFLGREFGSWAPSLDLPAELGNLVAWTGSAVAAGGAKRSVSPGWDLADGFRNAR